MSEEYTMSNNKLWAGRPPCQNNMCPRWLKGSDGGNYTNCMDTHLYAMAEHWPPDCVHDGGLYTDTPPPKPFTPKNPDDYIPGCRNTLCAQHCWALLGKCSMIAEGAKNNTTIHNKLCYMTCYDPAPKPKPKTVHKLKFTCPESEWPNMLYRLPNGDVVPLIEQVEKTIPNYVYPVSIRGVNNTCEDIITEEIDNEN